MDTQEEIQQSTTSTNSKSIKDKLTSTWQHINNFFTKPKDNNKTATPATPKSKSRKTFKLAKKIKKSKSSDELNDSADFTDIEIGPDMPEIDVQKLEHVQKNRAPPPKKTHRYTVFAPSASKSTEDLLVDKFYSSTSTEVELTRDSSPAGEKPDIKHTTHNDDTTTVEKKSVTTQTLVKTKPSEQLQNVSAAECHVVQKVAILPPQKPALLPTQIKPKQETAAAIAAQRKVSVTSSDKSFGQSMSSIDEEIISGDNEPPSLPQANNACQSPVSLKETTIDKPKNSEFPHNIHRPALSSGLKKTRPISEILPSSAFETDIKPSLYSAHSDENVLIRKVLLRKADSNLESAMLLRSSQETSRVRSTSESIVAQTSNPNSLHQENRTESSDKISLREKSNERLSNNANESTAEQRKSVFDLTKMFEKADNKTPAPAPPNRIRTNKIAPKE